MKTKIYSADTGKSSTVELTSETAKAVSNGWIASESVSKKKHDRVIGYGKHRVVELEGRKASVLAVKAGTQYSLVYHPVS